ncbi:MAG: hypothetical protein ACYDIA_11265 [Candidatus Humimicrobiaceae bacterium]
MELIKEAKQRKTINNFKKNIFWNAFREVYENYIKLIGINRGLKTLGSAYRISISPEKLENLKFKNLEESVYLNENDNYFIVEMLTLKEKVNIINNFLQVSWKDLELYKTDVLIDYIEKEIEIFTNLSMKFAHYIKIDFNRFLKSNVLNN